MSDNYYRSLKQAITGLATFSCPHSIAVLMNRGFYQQFVIGYTSKKSITYLPEKGK